MRYSEKCVRETGYLFSVVMAIYNTEKYLKLFIGSEEFINNKKRYCVWLKDADIREVRTSKILSKKIEIVKNLKNIFNDFDEKKSFKKQIGENKELNKIEKDRTAWESLRFIIEVIQQIRNTGTEEKDNDFILSLKSQQNFPTS